MPVFRYCSRCASMMMVTISLFCTAPLNADVKDLSATADFESNAPIDQPESVYKAAFAVYSKEAFQQTELGSAWLEAVQLCLDTFGPGTVVANEDHIKAAIAVGKFFFPETTPAIAIPKSAIPGAQSVEHNWIGIWHERYFLEISKMVGSYRAACAHS